MNNNKSVSKWSFSAPIRPLFRILGGVIALFFLSFSGYIALSIGIFNWEGFQLFFPSFLCGAIIGIASLKGRIPSWPSANNGKS
jgi:hypothetical protein